MKLLRSLPLALLALVVACSPSLPPLTAPAAPSRQAAAAPVCRLGPNDGPIVADRGIGGTGSPTTGAPVETADRGIGGTGAPVAVADRGVGGTGIIGVITGFGSICVDGLEVGYDSTVPVQVDGNPSPATALRAGQVAVIEANGSDSSLFANRVDIRHEVTGPVEVTPHAAGAAGNAEDRIMQVAGQTVALPATTKGETAPRRGDWVAVSGIRRADGTIVATRIDPAPPDKVTVHGFLEAGPHGAPRIGAQSMQFAPGIAVAIGSDVEVSGRLVHGVLNVDRAEHDLLAADPTARFGTDVNQLYIESFATVADGEVQFNRGVVVPAAPDAVLAPSTASWGVLRLERQGGRFLATGVRPLANPMARPGGPASGEPFGRGSFRGGAGMGGFRPAPVPSSSGGFGERGSGLFRGGGFAGRGNRARCDETDSGCSGGWPGGGYRRGGGYPGGGFGPMPMMGGGGAGMR